jgi:hypothetical protein
MNHSDDLNGLLPPKVADNVRIKVPEAVADAQEFFVIVSYSGRLGQALQGLAEFYSKTFRGIGTVSRDVQQNLAEIGARFGCEPKASLHTRVTFFLVRRRSSIS